jgi:EAL and modified HD-GYP domain-containing signal transduction protein
VTASPARDVRGPVLDVFVARQPIFDAAGNIYAYELLYRRNGAIDHADGASSDVMGSEVLVQTFLNMGVENVTGGARAFMNFTRDMLTDRVYELFDPTRVVIELLETVVPDAEVIAACEAMVLAGYTLALDDFVYSDAYLPLIRLARVIKLDVLGRPHEALMEDVKRLAPFDAELLAERVETPEVRDVCRSLGFRYFQGYFFSRPEVLVRRDLSAAQLAILRLMNLLHDAKSSDVQIDDAFRGDVSLALKLLKIVNSASVGGRGIESLRHAVRLVGRSELHKWLSMLLVTSVATSEGTSGELVHTAVRRARMCELVAFDCGDRRAADALFMVGLFSLIDVLLRTPMHILLKKVELGEEVRRALLTRSGPYAPTLALVEAYERGSWDVASAEADSLGMEPASVTTCYLTALAWARERTEN